MVNKETIPTTEEQTPPQGQGREIHILEGEHLRKARTKETLDRVNAGKMSVCASKSKKEK